MMIRSLWMRFLVQSLVLLGLAACGDKQPKAVDENLKNPSKSIDHSTLTSNCADCHEADRAADSVDLITVKHGLGADCAACHTFSSGFTKNIKPEQKAHNPPPTICMGCHNRKTEQTKHAPFGECATCHKFDEVWKPK